MFPQEAQTPPLHSRQQPRSKDPCSFGPCGVVPNGKRGLTRGAYFFLHAHHTSFFLLWHTSSFVRAVALPSCFVTPLPSFSTYLFHLPLPSASSICSSICLFHRRQRSSNVASSLSLHRCRFIAVASSLSLLHCHNAVASEAPHYLLGTLPRRAESYKGVTRRRMPSVRSPVRFDIFKH